MSAVIALTVLSPPLVSLTSMLSSMFMERRPGEAQAAGASLAEFLRGKTR